MEDGFGVGSIAAGSDSSAIGGASVAFGTAVATGHDAVAMGRNLDAAGESSVVLGSNVTTTQAAIGSFAFGDTSSPNQLQVFLPNQFKVRASRGSFFYAVLGVGASAWSSLSDVSSKENFRDLDGAEIAAKLARMSIREWNYKAQDGGDPPRRSDRTGLLRCVRPRRRPAAHQHHRCRRHCVAGVKALALENERLKAELAALRARLERLEGQS